MYFLISFSGWSDSNTIKLDKKITVMEISLEFWNKYVPRLENIQDGKEIIRKIEADLNIL